MAETKDIEKNTNWSFTYRHIAHVGAKAEFATEDDFRDSVIAKFQKIHGKKMAEPAPIQAPEPTPALDDSGAPFKVIKAQGPGWFNVVGPDGVPVNDKGIRKADAEALAAEKNADAVKVA